MRTIQNEKGLTLVEVTAVLVLTLIILSSLIYLLNHTNAGVKNVKSREQIMQQSRMITEHIVATVRDGFIMENDISTDLKLTSGTQTIKYKFDNSTNTLEVESSDTGITPTDSKKLVLSDQVYSIGFKVLDGEMEITLTMILPNNATYTTSTIVNSIIRKPSS
ncbi:hypothetical protein [Paenibacillus sp. L3-i20]|uniref:hypothetical protein n=1 Tax=Paenibacillus sp. L3-i20 TaxID=2905833 RepID=UPI001EDEEFDD|nr:hypothetical protein [Paenibacillus sp. L3-i20]GKU79900.1 hypothetical protein L3i20_v242970 [Paenibacillus sp. L3-i20]